MADTVDTGLLPRTYFKAPRVPFDFRALALGILGYLVYWAGALLIDEICGKSLVVGSFLAAASDVFQGIPFLNEVIPTLLGTVLGFGELPDLETSGHTFWHVLLGGIWVFAVWSFFGQMIHRITSLRIARDEGLSFVEAILFALKNWVTILLAPVIIAITIAFFFGCNALAGLVISIPFVGQIFGLILLPLALISTLLILLIGLGGILGLPIIAAAAAWERNGTLDAISRAFSYVFARPLQFFWNYFLIFLFVGVILLVGGWFTGVLAKSIDAGVASDELSVLIDAPKWEPNNDDSEHASLSKAGEEAFASMRDTTESPAEDAARRKIRTAKPYAKDIKAVGVVSWQHKLSALMFWVLFNLIGIGIIGYAIYWFLGATTSVYADLRADVDGTEEDEIYLEEEEEDFDALTAAAERAEADAAPTPEAESPAPAEDAPADDAAPEAPADSDESPNAEA